MKPKMTIRIVGSVRWIELDWNHPYGHGHSHFHFHTQLDHVYVCLVLFGQQHVNRAKQGFKSAFDFASTSL